MGPGMLWQSERSESQRTLEDEAKTESRSASAGVQGKTSQHRRRRQGWADQEKIGHSLVTNPNRKALGKSDHPYFKGKSQYAPN